MPNQVPYGLHRLSDVKERLVTEIGVDVVNTNVNQAFEEYNRQLDQLLDLLVFRTQDFKTVYRTAGRARTQPMDEDGRADPIKSGAKYEVGFPLNEWGLAWGANWITREKMTGAHVIETVNLLQQADANRLRDEILIALFQNADYTYFDDERGNITVKPIANNDAQVYQIQAGADVGLTDNHLLSNASVNLTNAIIESTADDLREHPENGDEVTIWVPTAQRAVVAALTGFLGITDNNVALGVGANRLVGRDGRTGPGELFGYVPSAKAFVREWKQLPTTYIVGMTNGGDPPIAMREEPEANLRGYKAVAEREDFPFWQRQYRRRAGFGAYNRVGAIVLQLNNAGAYAVPTGFTRGS